MKTIKILATALATRSVGANANLNEDTLAERSSALAGRNRLRRSIQLALAGSVLASGIASAALQDFGGVSDNSGSGITPAAILNWPAWYRDNDSLPVGLCKSQVASVHPDAAGAPMCFAITPNTAGFAGNVGDEIFYMNLNAFITNGGIKLRYVTALEAAYASGAPVKGQEIVFARTRFTMTVNPQGADGQACAGSYRIIHPWGESTFDDVPVGPRALFETADVGIAGFDGSLQGPLGPFPHWDGDGDEVPLARTAANFLKYGANEFIGDPSVSHTYTGSPFIETLPDGITPRYFLADGTPQHQNYLKVIAPAGCDIGGTPAPAGEGINVQREVLGNLMGQVWTAAIPTPTRITQADFTRTASSTTVDVWAKSAKTPAQSLQLTGSNFPGVVMTAVTDNGARTGMYQAHIVLPPNAVLPSLIDVVNSTSTPVLKTSANLSDIVHISKAVYNPATGNLCVSASSSDDQTLTLTADSNPLTAQLDSTVKPDCPKVGNDLTAMATFPLNRAPDTVRVVSELQGSSEKHVTVLATAPDNSATLIANDDAFLAVPGSGAQTLDVGANDGATGQIVIVDQPGLDANDQPITTIVGTVTGSLTGGTVTFTANPGATGVATFSYFIKNGANVSNLVNATADIVFVAAPPTGSPDNFGVLRTNNTIGFTAKVLANDVAAFGTTINPASVAIVAGQGQAKGVATANANGTVTYKPNAGVAAGNDFFLYTVNNNVGIASTPVAVSVVVENAVESVSISRNKMTNTGGGGQRYDIRFTTSWFGAPLTSTGSCYLVRVNGVALPTERFLGSAPVDATGAVQFVPIGTKLYNAANYTASDIPLVPAKTNYTIRCGTSNLVNPLPAATATSTADNSTTSP